MLWGRPASRVPQLSKPTIQNQTRVYQSNYRSTCRTENILCTTALKPRVRCSPLFREFHWSFSQARVLNIFSRSNHHVRKSRTGHWVHFAAFVGVVSPFIGPMAGVRLFQNSCLAHLQLAYLHKYQRCDWRRGCNRHGPASWRLVTVLVQSTTAEWRGTDWLTWRSEANNSCRYKNTCVRTTIFNL